MTGSALGLLLAVSVSGIQMLNSTAQPVRATLNATPHGSALRQNLVIREFGGSSAVPIRFYDRDMTKKLHLIAVDDRLQTFMHVHPALQPDGSLRLLQTFPHAGNWHLYADGIPHNFGRQVFRFDLTLPQTPGVMQHSHGVMLSLSKHTIAPYAVTLDRKTLPAGKLSMVHVHISKSGKPASDLRPFLGARAHAVVIGTDLSYIHAHAMAAAASMPGMSGMGTMPMPQAPAPSTPSVVPSDDPCGQDADVGMSMVELPPDFHVKPDMMVMLQPAKPGKYFLWIQFRAAGRVYTAPFILTAV